VDREEDTFDKAKVVVESSRSAFNSLVHVDHKMIALLLALLFMGLLLLMLGT
jgi:hypothetical protein